MKRYDPPLACKCGDPDIKLFFGPDDWRLKDGIHSLRRCVKRSPPGTTCACGRITSTEGSFTKFLTQGGTISIDEVDRLFPRHIPYLEQRRRWWGKSTIIHGADRCESFRKWRTR